MSGLVRAGLSWCGRERTGAGTAGLARAGLSRCRCEWTGAGRAEPVRV
ncbi:hypothetical protein [Nonomuraea sp. PA05]|nr:hypothetical protein [Nonomuraea sp. PA05]